MSLTFIVPFSRTNQDRGLHLDMAVKYLAACPAMADIIVSEQGPDSSAKYAVNAYGVNYVYSYKQPNEPFCRSECINTALHKVSSLSTVVWDIDCYVGYEALINAGKALEAPYWVANSAPVPPGTVVPFTKAYGLTEQASQAVTDWNSFKPTDEMRAVVSQFSQPNFVGGIQCFRTNILKHIRGFNENFLGYGQEDNEVVSRVMKLGYGMVRMPGELFHRCHSNRTFFDAPYHSQHERNTKQLEDLLKLDAEAAFNYFGVTKEPGPYSGRHG
jgi:predicted glycosyltransferase involved in capsule biosynthesis